jgi:hypothetical protein
VSTERLSEVFLRIDRELKEGFSILLIIRALQKVEKGLSKEE